MKMSKDKMPGTQYFYCNAIKMQHFLIHSHINLTIYYSMIGFNFSKYNPDENAKSPFEKLLDLFLQLLTYTSGDFNEAMQSLKKDLDLEVENVKL